MHMGPHPNVSQASQTGDDAVTYPGDYARFVTQGWHGGNFNTPGDVGPASSSSISGYLRAYSGSHFQNYFGFSKEIIKPSTPTTTSEGDN